MQLACFTFITSVLHSMTLSLRYVERRLVISALRSCFLQWQLLVTLNLAEYLPVMTGYLKSIAHYSRGRMQLYPLIDADSTSHFLLFIIFFCEWKELY